MRTIRSCIFRSNIKYYYVGGCELATERIEACVTEMRSWMYNNKLQLKDAKTEIMLVCSVHNQSKFNVSHIQVGDSEIQPVSVVRNIGAQLDETLSMRSQVNSLCSRTQGRTSTCGTSARYDTCWTGGQPQRMFMPICNITAG